MEGVPARLQTFFCISPAGSGEAQCFAVQRGETVKRFDPRFHATSDMASVIKARYENTRTIESFCEFIDSGRPIMSRLSESGIPVYEVSHILQGELKNADVSVFSDADKILQQHDLLTGRV